MSDGAFDVARVRARLIEHEGLKLKPYYCTSKRLTIGVGRNLADVGVNEAEAMVLLDNDIARAIRDLDRHEEGWREQPQVIQEVLLDLVFNLGVGRWLKFVNTRRAMREGRYEDMARGLEASKWYRQVGKRAKTIVAMVRSAMQG